MEILPPVHMRKCGRKQAQNGLTKEGLVLHQIDAAVEVLHKIPHLLRGAHPEPLQIFLQLLPGGCAAPGPYDIGFVLLIRHTENEIPHPKGAFHQQERPFRRTLQQGAAHELPVKLGVQSIPQAIVKAVQLVKGFHQRSDLQFMHCQHPPQCVDQINLHSCSAHPLSAASRTI